MTDEQLEIAKILRDKLLKSISKYGHNYPKRSWAVDCIFKMQDAINLPLFIYNTQNTNSIQQHNMNIYNSIFKDGCVEKYIKNHLQNKYEIIAWHFSPCELYYKDHICFSIMYNHLNSTAQHLQL